MFNLKNESEILGRYGNNLLLIQFILSLAIFLGSLLYFIYVYYKKEEVRPHSQQEDKTKVSDEDINAPNPEQQDMSTNKLMDVIDTIMENIMEHDMKEIQEMQLDILNDNVKNPIYNNLSTESEKAAQNMENILNALLDEGESNNQIIDKKMNELNDLYVEKDNNYDNCIEKVEVQASISSIDFDYYPDMEIITNCPTKSDLNAAPIINNCNINTSSYSESTIARTKHIAMNNGASKVSLVASKIDCSNGDVSNSSKKSMRRSANTATTIENKKPFVTYCSPHSTFPPLESLRKVPTNKYLSRSCAQRTEITTTSSAYSSGYARKQMKTSNDMSVTRKKVSANKWNSN